MVDVRLPNPTGTYSPEDEQIRNEAIERELEDRWLRFEDIEIDPSTGRIILTSPNGSRYILTVDNAGVLGTTLAP